MEKMKLRRTNLKEYQCVARNRKSCVPGSANTKKILQFINAHYKIGDLFKWNTPMVTALPQSLNVVHFVLTSNKGRTSPVPMKHNP